MLPSFKVQNLQDTAQSNVPMTFGHVFAPGDLPAGRGLLGGASDGTYLPLQVDAKATHPDGSVRHAIISAIVPAIGGKGTRTYQLLDADNRTSKQAFVGVPASVHLTLAGAVYTAAVDFTADSKTWLSGSVVNERQYAVQFIAAGIAHPHLMARFAVRDYGSAQRVDIAIENNWAYEPAPQNFTYDAEITVGGQVVYSVAGLTHIHHGRWRQVFWQGAAPAINVQTDFLLPTRVAPNYDTTVQPAESTLAGMAITSKPMDIGLATAYEPTTGAHEDIGILPQWTAAYVVSMDSRARDGMLATGDGVGAFPMHFRDQVTDLPISITDFPYMTLEGLHSDTWNPITQRFEAFPAVDPSSDSPFSPDIPHHGSFSYVPYLVTGDHYHLEELQFWAMYCVLKFNPNARQQAAGLVKEDQLRGQAWGLRTLGQAAFCTPDDHPLKADLVGFVSNNLDFYNATYTNNPDANKLGANVSGLAFGYNNYNAIAPWMDDFFTQSMGHLVDLGFEKAAPLLLWKSKFVVGRMTAPGVCWFDAAIYNLTLRDTNSSPIYDTFAQAWVATRGAAFKDLVCGGPDMASVIGANGPNDMGNLSGYEMGYPANMQPALAYAVDCNYPGAKAAWSLFMSRRIKADYSLGKQFDIVPRDYVAAYVGPTYVPPDGWLQIASEGQTVTVPDNTNVRFGAGTRWSPKVMSGSVTANDATFGDPAPGTAKILQQFIPPTTEGNTMTFKITATGYESKEQMLPAGSEAALTSVRTRIMSPDGATVLAESATFPIVLTGLSAGVYPWEIVAFDSTGAAMGTAATGSIDTATAPVVVPPAQPISVSLPSGLQVSVEQEQ